MYVAERLGGLQRPNPPCELILLQVADNNLESIKSMQNSLSWSIGKDETYQDRLGCFHEFEERHGSTHLPSAQESTAGIYWNECAAAYPGKRAVLTLPNKYKQKLENTVYTFT